MQQRTMLVAVAVALAGLTAAAQGEFKYFGPSGPSFWAKLDPGWAACGRGTMQSPVDFRNATLHHQPLTVAYTPTEGRIFNNEHTIEIESEGHDLLKLDGVDYRLQQFHFHALSEHTIEGRGTDMELHLVHRSDAGVNAVVAVLLTRGKTSGALAPILAQLPDDHGVKHRLAATFDPAAFLPANRDYYRYEGSLTTPPCTEGVHWIVLRTPMSVSSEDLAQFAERIHLNARPVQRVSR